MIAFGTSGLGCCPFGKLLPGYHAFADMYTPVIGDTGLIDLITRVFQYLGHAPSQEIIPEMTHMQWLVGIGGGVLHHYFLSVGILSRELRISVIFLKDRDPIRIGDSKI